MERIGLASWHGHAVLGESVWLLLAKHVAGLLLAWSFWICSARVLASKGDAGHLLLNVTWMLIALAFASRVLGLCTWRNSLSQGVSGLSRRTFEVG